MSEVRGILAEARAVGPRRVARFIANRVRDGWRAISGDARRRHLGARVSDAEWRLGAAGGREQAVATFLSGGTALSWAGAERRDDVSALLRAHHPDHVTRILREADEICGGTVRIWDIPVDVRARHGGVDWQRDWLGSHRWAHDQPAWRIAVGHEPGADPKVPWELGRSLHLVTIAQAFALTGDRRYSEAAFAQLRDFIARNPVGLGIQWTCAMDVAIRACNWMLAWDLLRVAPHAEEVAESILRSLVEHGRFIARNLEKTTGFTSNHYLANLCGMAYLARMEACWPEAGQWRLIWRRELPRELAKQILPDGFDFEASVSYHRLVLELLLFPSLIADPQPEPIRHRLIGMARATQAYLSSSGRAPQLGDNDGGRLHILHRRDPLDHSYLPALARALDSSLSAAPCPEAVWVLGAAGGGMEDSAPGAPSVRLLPHAGIAKLCLPGSELVLACGPNGQGGRGGHAHNDKLSIVLFVEGQPAIVDPGTFEYTRDVAARQWFQRTDSHSTVAVAGGEQNRFSPNHAFRLFPDAEPSPISVRQDRCRLRAQASHSGYERGPYGVSHLRRVTGSPEHGWSVLDILRPVAGRARQPFDFSFALPLPPDATVLACVDDGWRVRLACGATVSGFAQTRGASARWTAESAWYSANYGSRVEAPRLRLTGQASGAGAVLRTVLKVRK